MKILISSIAIAMALSLTAVAQTQESVSIDPVVSISTTTGFPHFQTLDWIPDMGDPQSLTGTITCSGATPGASGLMVASLAGNDELAFGFLPVLVDVNPMNISSYGYYGYDAMGSVVITNVSRQIPALVGMQMHIQAFEYSPLVTSSNSLRFDIAP